MVALAELKQCKQTPKLELVRMPQVTYIGELYETPVQRHPQETPIAELFGVKGLEADDGVYAVPVSKLDRPMVLKMFLSEAKKVTGSLPSKEGLHKTYGLNELSLSPEKLEESMDLRERPTLHRALQKGIIRHHTLYPLDFA